MPESLKETAVACYGGWNGGSYGRGAAMMRRGHKLDRSDSSVFYTLKMLFMIRKRPR